MRDPKRVPLLVAAPRADGASFADAVVSLVKVCVGSGVMALPWAVAQGRLLSLPGLAGLVVWNWYTSWQLIACRDAVDVRVASGLQVAARSGAHRSVYSALTHAALGRAGVLVLEGSLVTVILGACSSMQIQSAQLLDASVPGVPYTAWVLGGAVLLAPLVLQRTLQGISRIAQLGLLVLCVGLATVAAYGVITLGPPRAVALGGLPTPSGFAAFFGVAAFAFGGMQATILPIQDGMREPRRAAPALLLAMGLAGGLYAIFGLMLASIFEAAPGGVQQMIILNLPRNTILGRTVDCCTALVALLSYPLPLLPVVQLLQPPGARDGASDGDDAHRREARLRLALLLVSTTAALFVPQFGRITGFLGCLNVAFAQCLPPLLHLRLRTAHLPPSPHQRLLVAVDFLLALLGLGTLAYFSALTGRALLGEVD